LEYVRNVQPEIMELFEKSTSTGTQSDIIIMLVASPQCTLYLSYLCNSLGEF